MSYEAIIQLLKFLSIILYLSGNYIAILSKNIVFVKLPTIQL